MTSSSCPRFEGTENRPGCSAPICPLDAESMRSCTWFPDEEVCALSEHRGLPWIVRQKAISKAMGKRWEAGAFTVTMLSHRFKPGGVVRGLDPEKEVTPARVRQWIADHPAVEAHSGEANSASKTGHREGSEGSEPQISERVEHARGLEGIRTPPEAKEPVGVPVQGASRAG